MRHINRRNAYIILSSILVSTWAYLTFQVLSFFPLSGSGIFQFFDEFPENRNATIVEDPTKLVMLEMSSFNLQENTVDLAIVNHDICPTSIDCESIRLYFTQVSSRLARMSFQESTNPIQMDAMGAPTETLSYTIQINNPDLSFRQQTIQLPLKVNGWYPFDSYDFVLAAYYVDEVEGGESIRMPIPNIVLVDYIPEYSVKPINFGSIGIQIRIEQHITRKALIIISIILIAFCTLLLLELRDFSVFLQAVFALLLGIWGLREAFIPEEISHDTRFGIEQAMLINYALLGLTILFWLLIHQHKKRSSLYTDKRTEIITPDQLPVIEETDNTNITTRTSWTTQDVASKLGITTTEVAKKARNKEIPARKIQGKWYFDKEDIEKLKVEHGT